VIIARMISLDPPKILSTTEPRKPNSKRPAQLTLRAE
jgi:hypothetical protein